MYKKNNNKDSSDKKNNIQFENDNEIIEGIMNNPLLFKNIEDLEEEENEEDNYSEKDRITEEILDNKLSFIPPKKYEEDEDKNKNKINNVNIQSNDIEEKNTKTQGDIIEDLLIELFKYHYKGMSTVKKINLENKLSKSYNQIENFCEKFKKNFSYFILLILEQKISELLDYIKKNIKIESVKDILEIKNSLKLTGTNINKLFEKPFKESMKFDVSSIIVVLFISEILGSNKINISEEEYEEIVEIDSLEEKDRFQKYIEECKQFFEKIKKGEYKEDVEVYEEEKQEDLNDIETNNSSNNINEQEIEENEDENYIISDEDNNNNKNIKNLKEKKDKYIIKDIINKNNNLKKNNYNNNIKEDIPNQNNNIDNKSENYSNIEDLVKYINGGDKKKKKKKKRKKKSKISNDKKIEEQKENNVVEKDEIFENFKAYIINFTNNLQKVEKIKPKISDAFLEKLKLIN